MIDRATNRQNCQRTGGSNNQSIDRGRLLGAIHGTLTSCRTGLYYCFLYYIVHVNLTFHIIGLSIVVELNFRL